MKGDNMNTPSDREWELAESKAENIKKHISEYMTESVVPSSKRFVQVEVLIPLTENINQTFIFEAPYEYMDADNTQLKEYFNEHVCKIDEPDVLDYEIN